jgi:hypothetical protein
MARHVARMMDGDAFSTAVVAADIGLAAFVTVASVAVHLA